MFLEKETRRKSGGVPGVGEWPSQRPIRAKRKNGSEIYEKNEVSA